MTTRQQLEAKIKEQENTIKYITSIADTLSHDELSLRDIVSQEEELESACQMLKDIMDEIVNLRYLVELEEDRKELEQYL